jgi:hypothetical protein
MIGFLIIADARTAPLRRPLGAGTGLVRAVRVLTPVVALTAAIVTLLATLTLHRALDEAFASQPAIERPAAPADTRAIAVTVTGAGQRAPWVTTVAELETSPAMWQRMHLADWDDVPAEIRQTSFAAMLSAYPRELQRPDAWDRMDAVAWDAVPQPIRVAAFRQMTAYWVGFYRLAARHQLKASAVTEAAQAIVMSESWFDHRAVVRDRSGNVDIGLGQTSTFARKRIRQLHAAGAVDFALSDAEYLNPWMATRFVAAWLDLLLHESSGDLELAVRAYNRGIASARDARGDRYLATVTQRQQRYIRGVGAPSAWQMLEQLARTEAVPPSATRNSYGLRNSQAPRRFLDAHESGARRAGGVGRRFLDGADRAAASDF